jgi:hypothetical protein
VKIEPFCGVANGFFAGRLRRPEVDGYHGGRSAKCSLQVSLVGGW